MCTKVNTYLVANFCTQKTLIVIIINIISSNSNNKMFYTAIETFEIRHIEHDCRTTYIGFTYADDTHTTAHPGWPRASRDKGAARTRTDI
ncbi:MAG: hypothetical protein O7D30_10365, partial [Rickettsia endosymbiont of Ixodes persulcatus]|nr:hypothetical protein [Rickettsia endosymbiont of Ixodes persulcatus]